MDIYVGTVENKDLKGLSSENKGGGHVTYI